MEGSIGRVFRSPVQPAQIGRKLERAMMSQQVVSVDATLVPNEYRVAMNPRDMVLFADYIAALCRQLEQWLISLARERGFTTIDRVRVQIVGEDAVPRRAIQVSAAIADRPEFAQAAQEKVQRTEVHRVIRAAGGVPPVRLRVVAGPNRNQELILRKPVTGVGRALDNDIVVNVSDISRHHARFEVVGQELRVVDLGSTNGTRLNGRRVTSERVRPGDDVSFGSVTLRILPFDGNGG